MKKIVFLFMLLFSLFSVAQENYQILIMPNKFDFLRQENEYNLNTMCKLFFEKEGFKVYFSNDILPTEIANSRCNALFLDLVENNTVFKTKVKVELKDCQNNLVLLSEEGVSREKNLNTAYNQATRFALKSLEGKIKIKNTYVNNTIPQKEVKDIDSEIVKETSPILVTKVPEENSKENNTANAVLYSKVTKNGYNLVDINGNTKFELLKTSNPTIFIAKKDNIQGIFTLNGQNSKFESYQNNELVIEKVEVKF
jgi:hypothetical protein